MAGLTTVCLRGVSRIEGKYRRVDCVGPVRRLLVVAALAGLLSDIGPLALIFHGGTVRNGG